MHDKHHTFIDGSIAMRATDKGRDASLVEMVIGDRTDARVMVVAAHDATKLLTVAEYQAWLAFGAECLDDNGAVRADYNPS